MQQARAVTDNIIDMRRIDPVADAEALRGIYILSVRKNDRGFVQDLSFHGDIAARASQYITNNGEMIGVFINGYLAGFGALIKRNETNVELGKLHLHPDYHGQGIGRRIAMTLMDRAKELGYKTVELHVTVTQAAAIGLYKKMGFIETERRMCSINGEDFDTVFMEFPL